MFCSECGSQLSEDAKFCPECGVEITSEDPIPKVKKVIQENIFKKIGKLPVIIGAVILVVVIIALNWNGKVDYVETVAKHTPFAVSQGLPYTYEEVLNQYLVSAKWKVRDEGDIHYVDISGKANGAEGKLDITIKVTPSPDNPDIVAMEPESVTFDGSDQLSEGEATNFLYSLFCLYDAGYEDLSVLIEPENETDYASQGEVSLTETFTDEDVGISFRYPAEWTISYPSLESSIVVMFDPKSTDDCSASFSVQKRSPADPDPFGVFSEDEKTVRETLNDYFTLLAYEDTMLGDVPAKIINFQESDYIVTTVLYRIDEDVYEIYYAYTAAYADFYKPMFDAVMDSYTVGMEMPMDSGIGDSNSEPNICFNDIPVSELLDFSASEVIQTFGNEYYVGTDGDIIYDEIDFYMLDDDSVGYITSFYPENFSINGESLDAGIGEGVYSDTIIDILGTDYEEEYSDWYYMTYHYPSYTVSFSVSKYNEVGNIKIYSSLYEENGLNDNAMLESQDAIEDYWRLSGSYSDSIGQSTLIISIYSSQEEGEAEIGSVILVPDAGQYIQGTILPIREGTYEVMTDTGEEIILIESGPDNEVILQMYVDGQYLEEYRMTEHYES